MYKKPLLVVLAAVACALTAPTIASATAIPDLPTGVHQAYIADADGTPESGSITLAGPLTLNSSTGLVVSCANTMALTFADDGTTAITAYNPTGCTTNVPGCTASTTATNLNWGDRFGYDTSSGTFRDYINLSLNVTFGAGCPVSGTFSLTGQMSPVITISGGVLAATFSGAASGSVTGPTGSQTWSGTLSSTSGIGSGTQLIY